MSHREVTARKVSHESTPANPRAAFMVTRLDSSEEQGMGVRLASPSNKFRSKHYYRFS